MWDALGLGFTMLDFSESGATSAAFEAAAKELHVPFARRHHTSVELAETYGTSAILIRPDHFIAWVERDEQFEVEMVLKHAIGAG